MKVFSSIRQLWDYCEFCPICQKNVRNVSVSVGPETVTSLRDFTKCDNFIELNCVYKYIQKTYLILYKININTNQFETNIDEEEFPSHSKLVYKTNKPYFYFYFQGHCHKCGLSST